MAIIKVVRTVTYEIEESMLSKLVEQMRMSLPLGVYTDHPRVKITVEHTHGPQWPTDGEKVRLETEEGRRQIAESIAAQAASDPAPFEGKAEAESTPLPSHSRRAPHGRRS